MWKPTRSANAICSRFRGNYRNGYGGNESKRSQTRRSSMLRPFSMARINDAPQLLGQAFVADDYFYSQNKKGQPRHILVCTNTKFRSAVEDVEDSKSGGIPEKE